MSTAPTDQHLIDRLQAGDDTAVDDLARDYGARMHQLALRFGILGYLAREIPAEVPALLRHLAA